MILITGANGFLGRHATTAFTAGASAGISAGTSEAVRAFLRRPDDDWSRQFDEVKVSYGELGDAEAIGRAVEGVSTVVHLASKNIDHDGSGFDDTNVAGTGALCRAASAAGVERFLYVSSVGVYGHGAHDEVDETTSLRPDTPFSRSKAAAEEQVLAHHRRGDFAAVILRHRYVYGDGDESVVGRLIKAARSYPFLINGGRAQWSFVLVEELAEVLRRFAVEPVASEPDADPIYHVTSGEKISVRELTEIFCATFGYRRPRLSVPAWMIAVPLELRERLLGIDPETVSGVSSLRVRLVGQNQTYSNNKLLHRLPGLELTPFAEGFARSLDYYRRFA